MSNLRVFNLKYKGLYHCDKAFLYDELPSKVQHFFKKGDSTLICVN